MGDFLTAPVSFTAARDYLARKVDLPTALGSLDISNQIPARIRAQSFFSAKVSSANILQALRTQVESIARGDYNYAEGRLRLKEFLVKQGYGVPDVGAKGEKDLTNLASTRRLNLILEQNVAMAHAVGQREVAENPAVMELFPCYEYRTGPNPRDEHAALDGLVLHKKDPFWQTHYPPWEFNCNCDVVDSEEQPNGQSSGFAKHSPMSGTLEFNGKSLDLAANKSGFEFDSTPQTVFGKPDFSTVKDPGLREQITAAFKEKFSAFGLAALNKPIPDNNTGAGQPASGKLPPEDMKAPEFELTTDSAVWRAHDPAVEKKLAEARRGIEEFVATQPGEQMQSVNLKTGQTLPPQRSKPGEPYVIDVREQLAAIARLGGKWAMLHNHDADISFGGADLHTFMSSTGLSELRILAPHYEFLIRKTRRALPSSIVSADQIEREYLELHEQLDAKYALLFLHSDLSRRADADLWERKVHEINLELSKRHGYIYVVRART